MHVDLLLEEQLPQLCFKNIDFQSRFSNLLFCLLEDLSYIRHFLFTQIQTFQDLGVIPVLTVGKANSDQSQQTDDSQSPHGKTSSLPKGYFHSISRKREA
jgi:hypothetical protein